MYDAIVVGARCAGSPTAMLLARKGYRVLLADRATFPSDTISTHIIWPAGVARLKRWGLLDKVAASNCPAIRKLTFDLGSFALTGSPPPARTASPSFSRPGARCSTQSSWKPPLKRARNCGKAVLWRMS
jgi:2-polyprenyl-6-methoxyphenol hydroxylase-like FAD-dependent oxidoreductase